MTIFTKQYSSIPRVQRVRRRLSTGEVREHFYHRPTGTALPPPSEPTFHAAYAAAEGLSAERLVPHDHPMAPHLVQKSHQARAEELETKELLPKNETSQGEIIYLTAEEVSRRWRNKITPETLANWRALRIGPPYSKFGKIILYRLDLLEKWEGKNLVRCEGDIG